MTWWLLILTLGQLVLFALVFQIGTALGNLMETLQRTFGGDKEGS